MYVQDVGSGLQYAGLQRACCGQRETTPSSESQSAFTARIDQVVFSAWSITISQQTTALIHPEGDLSLASTTSSRSARDQIAEMTATLDSLRDEGKISNRRARHLEKVLDLAAKHVDHGRPLAAARLMRHVARVMDKLRDRGRVSSDGAQAMIEAARSVVEELRNEAVGYGREKGPDIGSRAGVMLIISEFKLTVSRVSFATSTSDAETEDPESSPT